MTTDCRIAGVGAVTGYGWGTEELWDGLLSGVPAAREYPGMGGSPDTPGWVSRVPDGGDLTDGPTRYSRAMRAATREAIVDAQARGWTANRRVGLLHAIVLPDPALFPRIHDSGVGKFSPREYVEVTPSTPVTMVMKEFDFHGFSMNVSAMCASGSNALLTAKQFIDGGAVDDMVIVATDLTATPGVVGMFSRLGIAITDTNPLDASRPFQDGSKGFIYGEASAAMVVTNQDVHGYVAVRGGAMTHDGYHPTSVDGDLTYVRECVDLALDRAGVTTAEIDTVAAHGPGTQQCDGAERTLVDDLFPNASVYSMKPLIGHCQVASAAAEIVITAMTYDRGQVPAPQITGDNPIPQLMEGVTEFQGGVTLKSALGIGGHNAMIVLSS